MYDLLASQAGCFKNGSTPGPRVAKQFTMAKLWSVATALAVFYVFASTYTAPPVSENARNLQILSNQQPTAYNRRKLVESDSVRFAWGIFSKPEDSALRQVLRDTYLNSDSRICQLVVNQDEISIPEGCEIAYTFVLPMEKGASDEATDITYIPVGRKQESLLATWFHYASQLFRRNQESLLAAWFHYASQLDVDYVVKVDSTTIPIPSRFLDVLQPMVSTPGLNRVVGGQPRGRWDCGGLRNWECRQMGGRSFVGAELFFLSTDIASQVPSTLTNDDYLSVRLSTWLYDRSPELSMMQISVDPSHGLWENHPSSTTSTQIQERWDYLRQHNYDKKLVHSGPEVDTTPRWNGTSSLDEFYRCLPWKHIPNFVSRWNLP